MFPELFGFLIIAGALLVMVVRVISKRQQGIDTEELRASTEQLKAELTRSADAVIARMGNHIQHLEDLLRQADERNVRLEAGISEYKRLAGEMEERSASLNRELTEARKMIAELAAYQSVPLVPQQPIMPMASPAPMQRVDAQDFAAVLQKSMNREEPAINAQQATGLAVAMTRRPEEIPDAQESAVQENMEDEKEQPEQPEKPNKSEPEKVISPNAAKAKALLRSGYSVEETARETGMGRGAIELLKEMNKHDLQ